MPEGSTITALLGPTNTGKTHRAVERMLAYESGIIGLPLRLLAREIYDRISIRVGEGKVALVTGEEKRVPRRPAYWVCTVEAMPMDRQVEFLAVDEIQLAGHDQRGHVFTDRLLSARGTRETWFMGADTMRPLVSELLPTATIAQHPRLSQLRSAGAQKLSRLPPRSAVVGFSMPQVYEVAERLRAIRGGAAVVLGALSPRTRNAQVALFQSGEVDYLVATDAIGMGLNLDVNHVAFAALRKFDGKIERELDTAELAQIAGRAGRHLNDGTFGTIAPLALPGFVSQTIEAHRFPPLRRLLYRNSNLDFASIDALIGSLALPSRARALKRIDAADDHLALLHLARDPEVRARARGAEAVALLWEVCRIPDFKKLLFESHVALLAEVYDQLSGRKGVLDEDWLDEQIAEIDDTEGDIDTLIDRIAAVRIWTYVSHQGRWIERAAEWQEQTRAIEDRLSDALHDRLVARFVERGSGKRTPPARPRGKAPSPTPSAPESRPSSPFAVLASMRASLAAQPADAPPDDERWVEEVIAAPHERFAVDEQGSIKRGDQRLADLVRGRSVLVPEVKLAGLTSLGAGNRSRLLRRLVAFARDLVEELLAPLRAPALRELSPAGRGVVYQLEQGLGTVLAADAEGQIEALSARDRELCEAAGITVGERVIFLPALLSPEAVTARLGLCAAWFEGPRRPRCPRPGVPSFVLPRGAEPAPFTMIGYPVFGTRAIRADLAERFHQAMSGSDPGPAVLSGMLGCTPREVPWIAQALGA
ncbi:MAG: helicase-related protein [Byssovorax sp.]